MFDKLKNMIFEPEKPEAKGEAPAPVTPGPALGTVAQTPTMITGGVGSVNEELLKVLFGNINAGVAQNDLQKVVEMAETMKTAIIDEGTRLKAAAAALKLSFEEINASIDALVVAAEAEKQRFLRSDVAALDSAIASDTQTLDAIKVNIEATLEKLNGLTAQRDELAIQINNKQNDRNTTVAVFEATIGKVLAELEGERNKMKVYIPTGVKP